MSSTTLTYMIPGDATDPYPGTTVGASLEMPYGVYGRRPEHTIEDMLRSVKKHVAEVLAASGDAFLVSFDEVGNKQVESSWEVRLDAEDPTFRFPFAQVTAIGPDTSIANPIYSDVTQAVMVHLYPFPTQDAERAKLQATRLRSLINDALTFGAARGRPLLIPMWDFGGAQGASDDPFGIYQDTEARQPWDFMRVLGLTTETIVDPEDDRRAWVVVNFRAKWRRVPSVLPGHLVQSVRVATHPG